ncbi:ABC transporter [Endozoicomonas sp. (ex Bugula neritina AB1)]|nr:ABC transporter [Endozoicomonas sp. (ex Bugula neritina AB1)]
MSTLLSAQSVSYHLASSLLLDGVSFTLKKGDRIGLIGHNGCGKSTLLKLLEGSLTPHAGTITQAHHCLTQRVEQHLPASLKPLSMLDVVIEQLPSALRLSDRWKAELLLTEMGFDNSDWRLTAGALSGGQHTRVLLARALIKQPDLLLLDEPSNHLDLVTLLWLEGFLKRWKGSFILVSHDQRLLDNTTNCTWIMRDKTLQYFRLSCSEARRTLIEKDIADNQRHNDEQKEINRVEKSAKRLALWGREHDNEYLSRKAKNMEKRITKLKDEQTMLTEGTPWQLSLIGETLQANHLLRISTLDVKPESQAVTLFNIQEQHIKSGNRVAIIGHNGCGKSSLLRQLWQTFQHPAPSHSHITFHPRCHAGYYDQNLHQLKDNDTLLDALRRFAVLPDDQRKMALIGAGFCYNRHTQQVKTLSGGERSRLLFIGLTLARFHLLLLDEPTNHLDMEGKEKLAQTLRQFSGGFILVTHDRELIETSCNQFWHIRHGKLEQCHDIERLYRIMSNDTTSDNERLENRVSQPAAITMEISDEDKLFDQLIVLESMLEADKARKEKHQKARLQKQWHDEITRIKQLLGLNDL